MVANFAKWSIGSGLVSFLIVLPMIFVVAFLSGHPGNILQYAITVSIGGAIGCGIGCGIAAVIQLR